MHLSWDLLCQSMEKFHKIVKVSMTFCWKNEFKNIRKSVKKWFLGGPWGCPGTFPEPPGSRSGHFLRRGGDFGRIWSVSGTSRSQFGDPAGSSRDPKIDKKRIYSEKDGLGEAFFTDLIYRHRFESIFWQKNNDFQLILDTFCDSKKYESRIQHTFFAQAANLENLRFL